MFFENKKVEWITIALILAAVFLSSLNIITFQSALGFVFGLCISIYIHDLVLKFKKLDKIEKTLEIISIILFVLAVYFILKNF